MQEIARWDLNRLYLNEDILFPILELKEQYFVTKDVEVLSKLIQAIEKAEYYLYCQWVEESVSSDLTKLNVKVKELKSEVQQIIKHSEVETSDNINIKFIKNELSAWEDMYIQLRDRIEIEHNNKQLSFGQANNIAMNSENEKERLEVFELLTSTLHKEKEIFATVLNQIGRLRNAKSNEIEDREILTQSFHANGISEAVLFQMWNATEENLDKLVSALNVYKKGKESITWHELMTVKESNEVIIPFSVAVQNVYDACKNIDEELA
ncbi:oligoendopeptidase F, partial [Bacillus sp. ZZQ-131]